MNKFLINILSFLAKGVIKNCNPKIIAITGSVGKTSTKEVVYNILYEKFGEDVEKSYGNLNTEIGVPLSILKIKKTYYSLGWILGIIIAFTKAYYYQLTKIYPKILVLEYAADKPGDIEFLVKIARADIAIITEIGPAHIEKFKTLGSIAKEKMYLAKNLNPDGIAVLNQDNKFIVKEAKKVFFEKIWYHGSGINGLKNMAFAIAKIFNITDNIVYKALSKQSRKGRLNILKGIKNSLIIDDTYNSNPLSIKLALAKLREIKKQQKINQTIIVLGDMLELGFDEIKYHKEVISSAKRNCDILITVGKRFAQVVKDNNFFSPMDAGIYLKKIIKKNDLILVKGSQGLRMEKTIEKIIFDKKDIKEKLARQDKYWKAKPFKEI